MNARDRQALARIEQRCMEEYRDARSRIVGLEATLRRPVSRYHGRKGVVTEIMISSVGKIRALLMILRMDGSGYLNSDGETRQYRPLAELQFTDRRVFEARLPVNDGRAA